ncbi:MAG: hypothetical protein JEZ06_24935 [Anaerolineaceae bacterium]|nr:hypothetical protein [Anaerolineaceae bacterium]
MKIVASAGREDIAVVYLAEYEDGEYVELVEAVQPPIAREDKWVLLVSTLYGCPVECGMCDAGGFYHGKVSKDRMFQQIDFLIRKRYPDGIIPCKQFKIQFARMGEPAFNREVIQVLEELPSRYQAPGFMPSISTIAPHGTDSFFEELLSVKKKLYSKGNFQFQFSVHTTDQDLRDQLIPVKKWSFERMAHYGERFYESGDRKITLNFALAAGNPVDPEVLLGYFDPQKYVIKITPLNPTYRAARNGLTSYLGEKNTGNHYDIVENLKRAGYQVIVSVGDLEENAIGSNCGQFLMKHINADEKLSKGYLYKISE